MSDTWYDILNIDGRDIKVSKFKSHIIPLIIDAAKKCKRIKKIILFGSSIREDCTEDSDIDIAVFGDLTKNKMLTTKEYNRFTYSLLQLTEAAQEFDILYFDRRKENKSLIYKEVLKGEIIYG